MTKHFTVNVPRKRCSHLNNLLLQDGVIKPSFKIESDVSAVLVRNRRSKVVNQCFSLEMLGCVGHWGGRLKHFLNTLRKIRWKNNMAEHFELGSFERSSIVRMSDEE